MPYVPINLPSGVYKNGTELQAKGRWLGGGGGGGGWWGGRKRLAGRGAAGLPS